MKTAARAPTHPHDPHSHHRAPGASHGRAFGDHEAALPVTGAQAGKGVEYTCPMHPEVRRMGPGSCPICGMALEPVVVTALTGESAELRDMQRRSGSA